jgi:hypothetical protein
MAPTPRGGKRFGAIWSTGLKAGTGFDTDEGFSAGAGDGSHRPRQTITSGAGTFEGRGCEGQCPQEVNCVRNGRSA